MSLLKPALQAKWKCCSCVLSAGLVSQAGCHSSCSVTAPELTVAVCGGTCACLEKTLPIELHTGTNRSTCSCYYGCISISVVLPHLPYASNFNLFAVCAPPSSPESVFSLLLLAPSVQVYKGCWTQDLPPTPLPLLSLHVLFILNLCPWTVSIPDCAGVLLLRDDTVQQTQVLLPVRIFWS